jgi:hypothetical protein
MKPNTICRDLLEIYFIDTNNEQTTISTKGRNKQSKKQTNKNEKTQTKQKNKKNKSKEENKQIK